MAEETTSFFKLKLEGKDFFVQVNFNSPGFAFEVIVTDGKFGWGGKVSEPELRKQHKKLQMSWDEFCSQTKQALCYLSCGASSTGYVCQLKQKQDALEFSWKKHLVADDIKFQLGCITLSKQEPTSEALCDVLGCCLKMMSNSRAAVQDLEAEKQQLSSERNTALKRLEKIVMWKETLEEDLYDKFVTVLNEKKKKIQELEEEVELLERNGASVAALPKDSVCPSQRKRHPTETSASSNSDPDEQDQPSTSPRKSARLFKGDSLLLNENDDTAAAVVSAARRGRGARGKKKTPSKPVLPRVGSAASSTGSVKRGGSSASNKSLDNVDLDDLLDDI